jgi:hypothetical protein
METSALFTYITTKRSVYVKVQRNFTLT